MPTGHTAPVIDGEITTLSEFAYECSKSFVWSFREGDTLAYPAPDTYYTERLPESLKELAAWDNASEEEKYRQWSVYADEQERRGNEARERASKARERLTALLTEVKAQPVPLTHENFKQFMIDQLEETIKFDGTFSSQYYNVQPYNQWVDARRGEILRNVNRNTEQMKDAEDRNRESRAWISTLAGLYNLDVKEPMSVV